jgi:hypothetical protein
VTNSYWSPSNRGSCSPQIQSPSALLRTPLLLRCLRLSRLSDHAEAATVNPVNFQYLRHDLDTEGNGDPWPSGTHLATPQTQAQFDEIERIYTSSAEAALGIRLSSGWEYDTGEDLTSEQLALFDITNGHRYMSVVSGDISSTASSSWATGILEFNPIFEADGFVPEAQMNYTYDWSSSWLDFYASRPVLEYQWVSTDEVTFGKRPRFETYETEVQVVSTQDVTSSAMSPSLRRKPSSPPTAFLMMAHRVRKVPSQPTLPSPASTPPSPAGSTNSGKSHGLQ